MSSPDWEEVFFKLSDGWHVLPGQIAAMTVAQWIGYSKGGKGSKVSVSPDPAGMKAVEEAWQRRNSPEARLARAERTLAQRYPHLAG